MAPYRPMVLLMQATKETTPCEPSDKIFNRKELMVWFINMLYEHLSKLKVEQHSCLDT